MGERRATLHRVEILWKDRRAEQMQKETMSDGSPAPDRHSLTFNLSPHIMEEVWKKLSDLSPDVWVT